MIYEQKRTTRNNLDKDIRISRRPYSLYINTFFSNLSWLKYTQYYYQSERTELSYSLFRLIGLDRIDSDDQANNLANWHERNYLLFRKIRKRFNHPRQAGLVVFRLQMRNSQIYFYFLFSTIPVTNQLAQKVSIYFNKKNTYNFSVSGFRY